MVSMTLCSKCRTLTDQLTSRAHELLLATSQMAVVAGVGQPDAFRLAHKEVQRIRAQCEAVHDELQHHKREVHHHSVLDGQTGPIGKTIAPDGTHGAV